jgi:DNA-binding IclR family transcriptional regulator
MTPVEVVGPSRILGSHPPIPRSVIKSAGRVLQIMSFFDNVQRSASAIEIGASLGYPQSSTSMLLHSMSEMGYLRHDPQRRTYVPSSRMALAGSWLNDRLVSKGPLLELLEELHVVTGQAVLLATRLGLFSQYIHVVQAVQNVGHLIVGTTRHMTSTGTGHALLSTFEDSQIRRIVRAIGADATGDTAPVKVSEALEKVNFVRRYGFLQASSLTIMGGASIAMPLRCTGVHSTLAIAVFGAAETIDDNCADFLAVMRDSIRHYQHHFEDTVAC